MELEMDCLALRILLQKVCSYKCQFCTKICTSSGLLCQVHKIDEQNIKKKYLMCQILIKLLKHHAIPNSSLHNLKIYSLKGCRKNRQQRWIMYTYEVNTVILNIRIFCRRYHFRLLVFASTSECFYYWHWRVLLNVLQSIND